MQVAITGSSGLIGTALAASLRGDGHRVRPIVRRPAATPEEIGIDAIDLTGVDAVVNLAGAGIGDKRWDGARKQELLRSRVDTTRTVAAAVAAAEHRPALISGSAVGYYGSRGDEELTESSGPGDDFLADLCVQWEAATEAASAAGGRVAHLRTGIVLSTAGGALKKMLPLFRLGLGGRMGSGRQWMSWITIDDHVAAVRHLLADDTASGPFNLSAPTPARQADFAKALGHALRRPAVVPTPAFGPRLLLGRELAGALLNDSQRMLPARLAETGFTHAHPTLDAALAALLPR